MSIGRRDAHKYGVVDFQKMCHLITIQDKMKKFKSC